MSLRVSQHKIEMKTGNKFILSICYISNFNGWREQKAAIDIRYLYNCLILLLIEEKKDRERERERGVFHSDGVCIYVGVKQYIQSIVHWYNKMVAMGLS